MGHAGGGVTDDSFSAPNIFLESLGYGGETGDKKRWGGGEKSEMVVVR
jgi:hypothetical protein